MKLKLALVTLLIVTACKTSPPATPTTPGLCSDLGVIKYHAPKDFDPETIYIWDDTEANFLDTPETVERILVHNARYRALCGGS